MSCVSQRLSASWHSLLEPSCSRRAPQRPLRARPPVHDRRTTGFPCSTRFRYDLAGCRLSPEGGGVRAPSPFPLSCHLPDLPRPALATPDACQHRGSTLTRGPRRFTRVHPSRPSPRPHAVGRLTARFGFSRGLRTPSLPTTHATVGTGLLDTDPNYMQLPIGRHLQTMQILKQCDLTSHEGLCDQHPRWRDGCW